MWDFFQTVRHRHSIRRYQADMPVEPEKLHAILETAVTAPSAGDLQSYRIICVKDPDLRARLAQASHGQDFISEAPICLIFCSDAARSTEQYGERGRDLFSIQDATIVAAYAQLAVVAAGMGSTWVGMFDEKAVADILALEPGLRPLALLCVGYPAELPESSHRRRLDEVVTYR
ncbi:nitroreductase [Ectothiorhodospira shaposhnikovii]|uniref:nitroreductase family protein n=1 Tax=Ectothiorhodospira shaposhnikovii TaxID=1054 RepID=UPI001907355C|nr:nitroreductase family protein [Ectothiorhodospira shaposhnikovii]MBK1672576.1 nitroreductase [Ectothiorhodospira shaposhnikovii]